MEAMQESTAAGAAAASTEPAETVAVVIDGAVAGAIGGTVMMLTMVLIHAVFGYGPWYALKMPAYPFVGDAAIQPHFDAGLIAGGLLSHTGISMFWGALFAFLLQRLRLRPNLALGAAWGIVVWLAMFYVLLPLLGSARLAHSRPLAEAIVAHLVFGIVIAHWLVRGRR